ncbi:MAG: [protein-PII] uridylyltransferase [Paracoccaceae bacterium]|nr:[protein-PII] uridylyltransferase [Paracoccaceae bacterium]
MEIVNKNNSNFLDSSIFDFENINLSFKKELKGLDDKSDIRSKATILLKEKYKNGAKEIKKAFEKDAANSEIIISAYSKLTDGIVRTAIYVAEELLTPKSSSGVFAVLSVGGYGRQQMAPHSDVDILFLVPTKIDNRIHSIIENTLYILWDLKLKIGHATRSIKDCLEISKSDFTVKTALLESRFLYGDNTLAGNLDKKLWGNINKNSASEFVEAKLLERSERLRKNGGQRYVLEPNIKEGKGGLRDLQSLFWIAKYVRGVKSVESLVELRVFTRSEFDDFQQAENFLWAIRVHLHLISRRATEKLTFDLQVEIAKRMLFSDSNGRRAVEHFMQTYFRHATKVGEFTRIILTDLEAQHVKSKSLIKNFTKTKKRKPINPIFCIRQNRLDVVKSESFTNNPINILLLFEEALRTGYLIHPDTMRFISSNLSLVYKLQGNKSAAKVFIDTLLKHGNPERALRRMNELGVLGAFIPYFQDIIAMMQFNMYHSYTVDEHTIQVISNLSQIERGELTESLPIVSNILKGNINRKILYVALLLHDIGKGRDEDHSILGAKITREIAPSLGFNEQDCETIEWLVRNHLLMADMAQKRDIADPRTVRDFAKTVKSVVRLDLLTVITVCDIRGVGENTWNNWKAVLIRALYRQTRHALENGMEALNREQRGTDAKRKLRAALPNWDNAVLKKETNRHYEPYWQGLHVTAHINFAEMLIKVEKNEIKTSLTPDEDRDATRACFVMNDHPGIFSRISGALALVGANVVDARAYTSKDGFGTNAFWIQDDLGHPYMLEKLPKLELMIQKTLRGDILPQNEFRTKDKIKKRERDFAVPTSITFNNDGSDIYTIIEVDTRDRKGLLYDLSKTLSLANIYIASAVISTYGAQVVDTFYVKDMFGLKLYSKSKQSKIENKLKEAILKGIERAII